MRVTASVTRSKTSDIPHDKPSTAHVSYVGTPPDTAAHSRHAGQAAITQTGTSPLWITVPARSNLLGNQRDH
jgi:hypothetical protein